MENVSEASTRYIFVLDGSASMGPKWILWGNSYWSTLMKAVKNFATIKERGSAHDHLASCVVFAQQAKIVFRDKPLTSGVFDEISRPGGTADFGQAIDVVLQLVTEAPDVADTIVVIFMSSGTEAKFPNSLHKLQPQNHYFWKKLHSFWAVQFGEESAVMKKMAELLKEKGTFKNPTDIANLQTEYTEIAKAT